jgi:hypothetical protein
MLGNVMDATFEDGPEASEWLKRNAHEAALASNRFDSTAEGLAFVEKLYAAGAKRVFVPQDTIIADEEELVELGGPSSDTLVIELADCAVPVQLEQLYRQEATVEGFDRDTDPLPVIDGKYLVLWWD